MKKHSIFHSILCTSHLLGCGGSSDQAENQLSYDEIPASHSDTAVLGQAYSKLHKRLYNVKCVEGAAVVRGNEVGELKYERDMDYKRINDILNGELSVGVEFPMINAGASARIALEQSADEYSETHTFYWSGINRKLSFELGSTVPSAVGQRYIETANDQLLEKCGDEFVSEIQYGAVLMGTLRIDFLNKADKNEYGGALNIGIKGGIISVEGDLQKVDENAKKRIRVSVLAQQFGGDATGLLQVIPQNIVSCSLEDIEPCLATVNNLVKYGDGDFRASLNQSDDPMANWNVLKYVTQRYDQSGLEQLTSSNPPTDLDPEVARLRRELERLYLQEVKNEARADRLKIIASDRLDADSIAEIERLAQKAQDNARIYAIAQNVCYYQPSRCVNNWKTIKLDLQDYDADILDVASDAGESEESEQPQPSQPIYTLQRGESVGGQGGSAFDHSSFLKNYDFGPKIKRFGVRSGNRIDQIHVQWADGSRRTNGGSGGSYREYKLADDEYMTAIEVHVGHHDSDRIFYLRISTNKNNAALAAGKKTGRSWRFTAPAGQQIIGFYGSSGKELDRLGAIYAPIP